MKGLLFIVILCWISPLAAQSWEDLPEKYQAKLVRIKSEKKRLKRYAKYVKKAEADRQSTLGDSLKNVAVNDVADSLSQRLATSKHNLNPLDTLSLPKTSEHLMNASKDTLRSQAVHPAKNALEKEIPVQVSDVQIDSTLTESLGKKAKDQTEMLLADEIGLNNTEVSLDSTLTQQLGDEVTGQSKALLEEEIGTTIPEISLDSAGRANLVEQLETTAGNELMNVEGAEALGDMGQLNQVEDYKAKIESTQQELKQAMAKQQMKEKMASYAKEYITKHADKIQQVQSQMGELKKKYSYVPNSNDLSTAKKRTSLEDEPFVKRLVLGGNFSVSRTNPINIDLSPVIGYKINKLFEVGVTGIYRAQFEGDNSGVTATERSVYGYSLFVNHMVFRNYFGYVEGENISRVMEEQDREERIWDQTLLVGVGRKFSISKWLEMQAIVTYNLLHDNQNGVYDSPLVFKTAVRIKK